MISHLLWQLTGYALFEGRLFRAGMATIVAALAVFFAMPGYIRLLKRLDFTSDFDETRKFPTAPIMGGAPLVVVVLLVSLAFALPVIPVLAILAILVSYAAVGAVDDIAKIRSKRLIAQGKISKADYMAKADGISARLRLFLYFTFSLVVAAAVQHWVPHLREGHLAIPFVKPSLFMLNLPGWAFVLLMSFIVTATANGVNFTDGLDTLVSIPLITSAFFTGVVAYICGNAIWSNYLLLPHLPQVDELFIVSGAMIGALGAYLWYNSPPAEIYMGDTGSIGFGGAIGMMFIFVKAELFLLIVGAVFFAEALSVALQIGYFRATKGKRLFRMAPIHHHFQIGLKETYRRKGDINSKILWRFHLVSLFALIVALVLFFKVR